MEYRRVKTAGKIRVYEPEFLDGNQNQNNTSLTTKDDSFLTITPRETNPVPCNNRQLSFNYINGWLSEQSVKEVQEKTSFECSEVTKMYSGLLKDEANLNDKIDDILLDHIVQRRYKSHKLLEKWYDQAFLPLNDKIEDVMKSQYKKFDREKRNEFKRYLNHCNHKGHVFLDVYDSDEYNPMWLNGKRPGPLKAVVKKLRDPLIHQRDKNNEEDKFVVACQTGEQLSDKEIEELRLPPLPLVPLGRHGTNCSTWLKMGLTDIQSDVRDQSQSKLRASHNNISTDFMTQVDEPILDLEVFDKKNNWHRRRRFPDRQNASLQLV